MATEACDSMWGSSNGQVEYPPATGAYSQLGAWQGGAAHVASYDSAPQYGYPSEAQVALAMQQHLAAMYLQQQAAGCLAPAVQSQPSAFPAAFDSPVPLDYSPPPALRYATALPSLPDATGNQAVPATACMVCCAPLISAQAESMTCSRRCQWAATGMCAQCGSAPSSEMLGAFCTVRCMHQALQANWCIGCGVRQKRYGGDGCGFVGSVASCDELAASRLGLIGSMQQDRSTYNHHSSSNSRHHYGGGPFHSSTNMTRAFTAPGVAPVMPTVRIGGQVAAALTCTSRSGTEAAVAVPAEEAAANHDGVPSEPSGGRSAAPPQAAAVSGLTLLSQTDRHRAALAAMFQPHVGEVFCIVKLNGGRTEKLADANQKKYLRFRSQIETDVFGSLKLGMVSPAAPEGHSPNLTRTAVASAKYGHGGEGNEQRRFTPVPVDVQAPCCARRLAVMLQHEQALVSRATALKAAAAGRKGPNSARLVALREAVETMATARPAKSSESTCDFCQLLANGGANCVTGPRRASFYSLGTVDAACEAANAMAVPVVAALPAQLADMPALPGSAASDRSTSTSSSSCTYLATGPHTASTDSSCDGSIAKLPAAPLVGAVLVSRVVVGRPIVCPTFHDMVGRMSAEAASAARVVSTPAFGFSYVVSNGDQRCDGSYVTVDEAVDAQYLVMYEPRRK